MTVTGLVTAGLFFFLSQAKPLVRLSENKPPSTIFSLSVLLSILLQFIVHFLSLLAALHLCELYSPSTTYTNSEESSVITDGKFHPNVVNSVIYLLSSVMQINNFVVNYRGHPFTKSIQENSPLWRSVLISYGVLLVAATEVLEPLNDLLQLAKFPDPKFRSFFICLMAANFGCSWMIEKMCQKLG